MHPKEFKSILSLLREKNYSYNIPKDKELLMYDFYMISELLSYEKRGKFEPGEKTNAYGETEKTSSLAMGVRDNTLQSLYHITDQIVDYLKPHLLEASFYSVCCEFRHVTDDNTMTLIRDRLNPSASFFIELFYKNYKNLNNQKNLYSTTPNISDTMKQHYRERQKSKQQKYNLKYKENGRSENYQSSYEAVKKTIYDYNKNKNYEDKIEELDFVNLAKKCFLELRWANAYGGDTLGKYL